MFRSHVDPTRLNIGKGFYSGSVYRVYLTGLQGFLNIVVELIFSTNKLCLFSLEQDLRRLNLILEESSELSPTTLVNSLGLNNRSLFQLLLTAKPEIEKLNICLGNNILILYLIFGTSSSLFLIKDLLHQINKIKVL